MNRFKQIRYLLAAPLIIFITFVVASLLDIAIAVVRPRFYTAATFVVIFGVAGIFAGMITYSSCTDAAPQKTEKVRWSIISLIIVNALIYFFLLGPTEGGEYEMAFRSFAVTLAASTMLFFRGKI